MVQKVAILNPGLGRLASGNFKLSVSNLQLKEALSNQGRLRLTSTKCTCFLESAEGEESISTRVSGWTGYRTIDLSFLSQILYRLRYAARPSGAFGIDLLEIKWITCECTPFLNSISVMSRRLEGSIELLYVMKFQQISITGATRSAGLLLTY